MRTINMTTIHPSEIVSVTPLITYTPVDMIRNSLTDAQGWASAISRRYAGSYHCDVTSASFAAVAVKIEEAIALLKEAEEWQKSAHYTGPEETEYEGEECDGEINSLDHRHLYRD